MECSAAHTPNTILASREAAMVECLFDVAQSAGVSPVTFGINGSASCRSRSCDEAQTRPPDGVYN